MSRYEDPLFFEEWAIRLGYKSERYEPRFGVRTWDIDQQALAALEAHCGSKLAARPLVLQNCEAVLEALDSYRGQLGIVLQERTVTQEFGRLCRHMPVLGPISANASITVSYRESPTDSWIDLIGSPSDFYVVRDMHNACVNLTQSGIDKATAPNYNPDGRQPLGRVQYTAGFGPNVSSIPADLRTAIYTLTRRAYDYRDDFIPSSLFGLKSGGFLPAGVASTLARYQRNIVFQWR